MSETTYLVLGTSSMVLMMFTIILFVFIFQRKLAIKAMAYAEIEKLMHQQEVKSAYSLLEGQELERKRLAEELHDNIGGLLATLKIYSDLTLEKTNQTDIMRLNSKINILSESLSQEVRKLSHKLDLRVLSGFGFKVAVLQLCEAITESGKLEILPVMFLEKPLSEKVSLNLYRIVQELLTNTLKHAMATHARIEIALIENEITVIYEDDGTGFDTTSPTSSGIGLKNIHSRADLINAKVTVDSCSRGTTYVIELFDYE